MTKISFRCFVTALTLSILSLYPAQAADTPAADLARKFERPPEAIPGATKYIYKQSGAFALPIYVFAPEGTATTPRPAVVFFHGSGWHSGTVVQFVEHARQLAKLGVCAAVAEYRIKVDYDATPFDSVADAKSAIRWLRINADKLGLDSHHVAAAGGSAGAHIALCAGVFEGKFDDPADDPRVSARPDAIILFAPITDTTQLPNETEPNPLFGGRELELSPLHHLKRGLPPVQIFVGTKDQWATLSRARVFADAVTANGDTCDLIPFEGRSHFFYNHPAYYTKYRNFTPIRGRNDYDLCLFLMTRFLRDHGFDLARPMVLDVDSTAGFPAK